MTLIISDIDEGQSVSDIFRRVRNLLNDEDGIRWGDAELFDWTNDATNQLVVELPTARAVSENIALVDGARQSLEAPGAILLLDVTRNMKSDGEIGRAIRIVDRQLLDDQEPDWYTKARSEKILHYTFDERQPRSFFVYPPAQLDTLVEVVYSERPPAVNDLTDIVSLSPQYTDAIVSYICFRALSKEAEEGLPMAATAYYQAFKAAVGADAATEIAVSPNGASQ